jgi:hypothetical protein
MRYLTILTTLILAACGGGGGGSGGSTVAPPPVNQSVGGVWEGTDSDGDDIVGLVTEDGAFHFIDPFGQGFGTASVSNGNEVSATYTYVADLGTTFSDGSTSASCTFTGTVVERQSLTVNSECTSTTGNTSQVSVTLAYNALYNRSANLATIEGLYDDLGDVLSIDSAGLLFEQDATDGCVLNGQVSVVDPAFNAYEVEFLVEGCNAGLQELNGTTWSGIATLDNTVSPEELIFGVVGDVTVSGDTGTFALVGIALRI